MAIINQNALAPVNDRIIEDIKLVLRGQGHRFTGALENSIKPVIEHTGDDTTKLSATALDYIFDLEDGLPPGDPKFDSVDMAKLESWVIFRQKQGHISKSFNPKAVAKTLVKKWKKKGFELPGAMNYVDPNIGQFDKAIDFAFSLSQEEYYGLIDEQVFNIFDTQVQQTKSGTINSKS